VAVPDAFSWIFFFAASPWEAESDKHLLEVFSMFPH
jgi:hypothetical protein